MSDALLRRLTGIAVVANMVGQVLIVVTGGAVRLTGSGLGCSTWPECEPGSFTPVIHAATELHVYVEFGNRMLGVALGLIGIALAGLAARSTARLGRSRTVRNLAFVLLGGVLLQGVIGGISVRTELHPAIVGSHFLISGALVSLSTVLTVRWFSGDGPRVLVGNRAVRLMTWLLALLAVVVVVLGVIVTGAGPHSGDAEVGYRFAVDPYEVARLHAASVWVFLAVLVALVVLVVRARPALSQVRRWTFALLAVTLAQGVIGYVQFFTGLPELLVGAHMLGAVLLVAATARLVTTLWQQAPVAAPAEPSRTDERPAGVR